MPLRCEVALDPGDVGLDEVERARLAGGSRDVLQREDRVVLAEHPARHQAEQLADVPVEHAPAHAGRQRLGNARPDALDRREQALHHAEVGVDEAPAVEGDESRIGGERHLADLDQQRRDPAAISVYAASSASALIPAPRPTSPLRDTAIRRTSSQSTSRRGVCSCGRRRARADSTAPGADGSDGERAADLVASSGRTHGSIIRGDRRPIGIYIEEPDRPSM